MFDILFLGEELSLEGNEHYQIHYADAFGHKKDLDDYIAQSCFDIIIVDVHHAMKASRLKKQGYKGLIIGFSDNPVDKKILVKTLAQGYTMYFSREDLEHKFKDIVEAYSNIPEFKVDYSLGGFDTDIYDEIIKPAGLYLYEQFAHFYFETHPKAKLLFIAQNKTVIDHENIDKIDDYELNSLMLKYATYIFVFPNTELVPQLAE